MLSIHFTPYSMVPSYKCVRTSYVIIIFIAFIDACDTHTQCRNGGRINEPNGTKPMKRVTGKKAEISSKVHFINSFLMMKFFVS